MLTKDGSANFIDCINQFFSALSKVLDTEITSDSHSAIPFELLRIHGFPYVESKVMSCLSSVIVESGNVDDPYAIARAFAPLYEKSVDTEIVKRQAQQENDTNEIWFQLSSFCLFMLPHTQTDDEKLEQNYPGNKMTISAPGGLPYGSVARILILYLNSMAVKYKTREINVGSTISEFVKQLGYAPSYKPGKINEQVNTQLDRLFKSTFFTENHLEGDWIDNDSGSVYSSEQSKRLAIFDQKESVSELFSKKRGERGETSVKLLLSEPYYEEIIKHPVPLSVEAIKQIKKSPMALDLYFFISYRSNTKRFISASLEGLKAQFAAQDVETWRFKEQLDRGLQVLRKAWPDCRATIDGSRLLIPVTKPLVDKKAKKKGK